MKKEIAVLIPCLNEEKTIKKVIDDFRFFLPNSTIYVCDNNSTDNTGKIAEKAGATVFFEYRKGKANAVLKLFNKVDADIYVLVDGDDTYPAKDVVQMINTLVINDANMIVGDRLSNKSYLQNNTRKYHNFGNKLINFLINTFFNILKR